MKKISDPVQPLRAQLAMDDDWDVAEALMELSLQLADIVLGVYNLSLDDDGLGSRFPQADECFAQVYEHCEKARAVLLRFREQAHQRFLDRIGVRHA